MNVRDRNLDYFQRFMPYEEGKDITPTQFAEWDWDKILPQIEEIVEYLNANYAELGDGKAVYHYYKNNKREEKFLGVEIILDNPESLLRGAIRIFHRECEKVFYYTFECGISEKSLEKTQGELIQMLRSIGLRKLPHSGIDAPIFYHRFKEINLSSFKIFYGNLEQLSKKLCLVAKHV